MAARKRKYQTEQTREKIRVTQIVNRLNDFVDGKVEMSASQVTAAKILLDKTLPNLSQADVTTTHEESRTYEDYRAELVARYGEERTRLILGESPDLKVVDGRSD